MFLSHTLSISGKIGPLHFLRWEHTRHVLSIKYRRLLFNGYIKDCLCQSLRILSYNELGIAFVFVLRQETYNFSTKTPGGKPVLRRLKDSWCQSLTTVISALFRSKFKSLFKGASYGHVRKFTRCWFTIPDLPFTVIPLLQLSAVIPMYTLNLT